MPTYEYVCRACGHEFEEFQSIKADPISTCPKCRKRKVGRKIGIGGAVLFKGGGFYETDYRSESYQSGAEAEKKAGEPKPTSTGSAEASAGPGAASDAKPAAASGPSAEATPATSPDAARGSRTPASEGGARGSKPAPEAADRAEKQRIDARATHPSRVGRGIGNVVGRGGAKGSAPKATRAAKSAGRSAGRTGRRRGS